MIVEMKLDARQNVAQDFMAIGEMAMEKATDVKSAAESADHAVKKLQARDGEAATQPGVKVQLPRQAKG